MERLAPFLSFPDVLQGAKAKKKMEELEKAFNELKQSAQDNYRKSKIFGYLIEDKWGVHYSDGGNSDEIANTLEYGIENMSFVVFCQLMDEMK